MTFFTQDENKNLVEAVSGILAQRVAGMNLPEMVREAAIEAGQASVGKSLEERRQIMHHFFNSSSAQAQVSDKAFRPTNETVRDFNEVAMNSLNQHEAAESAGSFEDVADDPGSPLSAEDRARLNKRKVREEAESAGSFEDVADDAGSPLSAEDRARLNKRKVRESALAEARTLTDRGRGSSGDGAQPAWIFNIAFTDRQDFRKNARKFETALQKALPTGGSEFWEVEADGSSQVVRIRVDTDVKRPKAAQRLKKIIATVQEQIVCEAAQAAGSFEDVADDAGSPLSAEDRARLNKRKVKEELRQAAASYLENLANFGDKKKKFPPDKDGDGKVNEQDTSGTDKEVEDVEANEREVSVKAKTVRQIDTVPVSATHSFVKESWTVLVNTDELTIGEQHLLAGNLVEEDEVIEASAGCPTNRQPFTATVSGRSEVEAIENLVCALENVGSQLNAEHVLVAHRTPSKG